jgi:hypothetical protein
MVELLHLFAENGLKDSNYRANSEVHLARDLLDGHTSLAFG